MKHKNLILKGLLFITLLGACSYGPDPSYLNEINAYRANLNREFADTTTSPLTPEGLAIFKGLDFFPVDEMYRVEARFVLNPDPEPFEMVTTTARRPIYVKYGIAYFTLGGKDLMLEIYQSEKAKVIEELKDYLFLPFMDLTNGVSSYGGGRFLDLKIPEGNTIIIDFNKAYNPYCAYNHRYSCPVPPEANHLNIEIPVGVKAYDGH